MGVFTRDYRKNIRNCQVIYVVFSSYSQILVTVPSCLEILLTHGVEDPFWAHKLKYVIFDEVHSIGSDEGDVWERLLLLIECPCIDLLFDFSSTSFGSFSYDRKFPRTLRLACWSWEITWTQTLSYCLLPKIQWSCSFRVQASSSNFWRKSGNFRFRERSSNWRCRRVKYRICHRHEVSC